MKNIFQIIKQIFFFLFLQIKVSPHVPKKEEEEGEKRKGKKREGREKRKRQGRKRQKKSKQEKNRAT